MESAIKLLQNKFRSTKIFDTLNERTKSSNSLCIVEASIHKIKFRILVLKECCLTKDPCVLYDSQQNAELNNEQNSDWNKLTELIFGTAVTNRKSSTILKVHELRDSNELLISNVFTTTTQRTKLYSENSLDESEPESGFLQNRNTSRRKACTLPNYTKFYCNSVSTTDEPPSLELTSDSLLGNFHPKSFHSSLKSHQAINRNNQVQCSSDLQTSSRKEMTRKKCSIKRKNKCLAFGLLCQLEPSYTSSFIKFFYENFPLFETHLDCLKSKVESAVVFNGSSKPYVNNQKIKQALKDVAEKFNKLYATPRLTDNMWIKINLPYLHEDQINEAKNSIVSKISQLLVNPENKSVNKNRLNFVSSLITSVMTHHLGWVSSVTSQSCSDNDEVVDASVGNFQMYNPLLAQLRDLYGAVDYPSKICKTVISGLNSETVLIILTVVSYFIRCARIEDTVKVPDIITPEFFGSNSKCPLNNATDSLDETLVPSEIEPDSDYVLVSFTQPSINKKTRTKSFCETNNRSRSNAFIEFKCGSYGTTQSSSDEGNDLSEKVQQATAFNTRGSTESFGDDQYNTVQSFNFNEEDAEADCYEQPSISFSAAKNEHQPKAKVFPPQVVAQEYFNVSLHHQTAYESCNDKTKLSSSGDDLTSVTSQATGGNDFMFKEISMDDIMPLVGETPDDDDDVSSTYDGYSSLMTGYNNFFSNDFVLQGVAKTGEQTKLDIIKDLRNFNGSSVLDDVVVESKCILADTDTWTVKLFSSKKIDDEMPCINSKMVQNLLLQVANMHSMNIQSSFCLEHLERGLQIISMKAQTLSTYYRNNKKPATTMQLSSELGIDGTDVPLLMAVSQSYQPCYDLL